MNKLILKKIPIFDLLNVLHRIYDEGGDYIDIEGSSNNQKDEIIIYTREDYYSNIEEPKKLTDDDINKLIN